ncbi:hypothetical protein [Aureimonas psammosilenae]|uniref:hypothetical protein n=1 Tax=Aureimonas psammosilenae TaxID=2495496 RepID=UPI00126129A0|nr:hypothetical protein [Aureimonas psammosilenae]
MTDAERDERPKARSRRGRISRRRAAAARHSRAYRERQKARGVPTGAEIDAMIARIMIENVGRPQGLKMDATQLPRLCQRVAERFAASAEPQGDLEHRVAARVERMRAPL